MHPILPESPVLAKYKELLEDGQRFAEHPLITLIIETKEKNLIFCMHGGGGFFFAWENFWSMQDHLFPACAIFF